MSYLRNSLLFFLKIPRWIEFSNIIPIITPIIRESKRGRKCLLKFPNSNENETNISSFKMNFYLNLSVNKIIKQKLSDFHFIYQPIVMSSTCSSCSMTDSRESRSFSHNRVYSVLSPNNLPPQPFPFCQRIHFSVFLPPFSIHGVKMTP